MNIKIEEDAFSELLEIKDFHHKDALSQHSIVAITDLVGNIIDVNEKFCLVSGYTKEELVGNNHRIINSGYHSKLFWAKMWKDLKNGKTFKADIKNKKKNGDFYWVDTTIYPIKNHNGEIIFYFSIRTEITDRLKQHQEELNKQRRLAELGDQLQRISHDLKNNFMIIRANLDAFLDKQDPNYHARIQRSLDQTFDLLQNLSQGSTLKKSTIVYDGKDFLNKINESFQAICEKNNIELQFISNREDFSWTINNQVLFKTFSNLITNAIEAVEDNNKNKIIISVEDTEFNPLIKISDNGTRICPTLSQSIFEKGFSTKSKNKNSGLGLYSVKKELNENGFDVYLDQHNTQNCFIIFPRQL